MSLILVVDPDSRHAAHVASMARQHLKAEFVTADSGFRALEVLADRVPDIVLTAPLLPTRDEAVLSDYLRALGDAGAHVQTLTIPILSASGAPQRGVRGRFRRDRPGPSPDGCAPELFAQQVHHYLQRAQQTRRVDDDDTPLEIGEEDRDGQDPVEYAATSADPGGYGEDIDLTPMLADLAEPGLPRQPEAPVAQALPPVMLARAPVHPPARVMEAELVESNPPADSPPPTQHLITLPATLGDTGSLSTVNVAVAVSVQVATQTVRKADSAEPRSTRGGSAGRQQLKPVQDEWGFFDPDQCGFRALLARLDAIADENGD